MNKPPSEDALLELIDRHFEPAAKVLELGRGDDCAILREQKSLALSADLFLEDVHFRTAYFTPGEIGHKALAVNLSDMAAMAAEPLGFTLGLGLPPGVSMDWLDEFLAAMAGLAAQHDAVLCGGDLSAADKIHISITVFGHKPPNGLLLRRASARAGDVLFLAGSLGLARAGLALLESTGRDAMRAWPVCCAAHLRPEPQIRTALSLGIVRSEFRPPALMDVSDGLARDLPRMLAASSRIWGENLGASLEIAPEMLAPELVEYAGCTGQDPVQLAVEGGEDYALLGACAPELWPELDRSAPGLMRIGEVTSSRGITCNGRTLPINRGFDHFAGQPK